MSLRDSRNLRPRRDYELENERQKTRTLETSLQRAHEHIKQARINNKQLRAQLLDAKANPFASTEDHLRSLGRPHGFEFDFKSPHSKPKVLGQLLDSYAKSDGLRKENKSLRNVVREIEKAKGEKLIAQNQSSALQEQVYALQQQILAKVDTVCAIPDDKFTKDFRCLISSIKSLSRSIHIPKDMDMLQILGVGCLLVGVDDKHWNTRARKKALVEAWIWSVLFERVFASPFVLSEKHSGTMTDLWSDLFGAGHDHGWPVPSAACEQWRFTTMEHSVSAFKLKEQDPRDDSTTRDNDFDSLYEDNSPVRDNAINIIGTRLATVSSKGDFAQIPGIVDRAMSLALDMSLQRCRMQITFPAVNANFVMSQMSVVADSDGEDIQDGVVAFIVHPGLTKWGDANGKELDQRYDIVPSLVQLEPLKACAPGQRRHQQSAV